MSLVCHWENWHLAKSMKQEPLNVSWHLWQCEENTGKK